MKRILPVGIGLALAVYALRRLNRLIADVEAQRSQIEVLQEQTEDLRALLEAQRDLLDAIKARFDTAENAILGDEAERRAHWRERLSDFDSLN